MAAIDRLAETPNIGTLLKGRFRGLRRLRVGNSRVIYEIQNEVLIVLIVSIAHRLDAN